jgi:isovaleryl-CoA dehydrogenase
MIPNAHRMFNFDLGETADAIRETVQNFAGHEIAPRADQIDKSNQFPRDLWPKLGALGLHGITVEEEYGGSGLGYLEHCIAMEEISRASAARIRTFASISCAATAAKPRSENTCPS